jgi:type IV pilus assembly protein PilV
MLRRRHGGFSLVEALVALVVLSIGMLGIAALYVESLRAGRSALLRTQAVMLAADMADRIRVNPTVPGSYIKAADDTGTLTAACDPGGIGCAATLMAANDIARWRELVDDRADSPSTGRLALPNGRGTIAVVGVTSPAQYTITVSWAESGQTAANTYVLRFES